MTIRYYDTPQHYGTRGRQGAVTEFDTELSTSYGIGLGDANEWASNGFLDVTPKVHAYLQTQGHDTDFPPIYYNPERKLFANFSGRGAYQLQTAPRITPTDNSPFWANWLDTIGAALKGWIVPLTVASLGGTNLLAEAGGALAGGATTVTAVEVAPAALTEVATEGTAAMGIEDFVGDLPLADDLQYVTLQDLGGVVTVDLTGDAVGLVDVAPGGAMDQGLTQGVFDGTYESPYTASDFLKDAGQVVNAGLKGAQLYQAFQSSTQLARAGAAPSTSSRAPATLTGRPSATGLAPRAQSPVLLSSPEQRLAAANNMGGSSVVPKSTTGGASSGSGPIAALVAIAAVLGSVIYFGN
jgi:hypothetical protein